MASDDIQDSGIESSDNTGGEAQSPATTAASSCLESSTNRDEDADEGIEEQVKQNVGKTLDSVDVPTVGPAEAT